jgi:GNAT superfamily N-acetyltransferase
VTTPPSVSLTDPLALLLHNAAHGMFPAGDFTTTHLPSPKSPADAVLAFFGHHVIASDVDAPFVRGWTDSNPFALSDVRFLAAFADYLGVEPGIYDAVFASIGIGLSLDHVGLTETSDRSHPRVVRALSYRDPATVRVFTDDQAQSVLVMGRGLAGRWEAAYEVDDDARGRGLGRKLIEAARQLAPTGEPVFLQISPGNVWSMKAMMADPGWLAVGSEILFMRNA